jgi:hypothetical protein
MVYEIKNKDKINKKYLSSITWNKRQLKFHSLRTIKLKKNNKWH